MKKTAKEFKTVEELGLSEKTAKFFTEKGFTANDLIGLARRETLDSTGARMKENWKLIGDKICLVGADRVVELVACVRELGLIRRDLKGDLTQCIDLFLMDINCTYPHSLQLRCFDDEASFNEAYEEYIPIKEKQIAKLKAAIASRLTVDGYTLIMDLYGLESGKPKKPDIVAKQLGVTRERLRQIEAKSRRKLAGRIGETWRFPSFEELFEGVTKEVIEVTDDTDVEKLDFGPRIFNALKRAGINTVKEVANYPAGDWANVKYITPSHREEIRLKMESLGYVTNL